ncbi:hypothetical protein ADA01nite_31130 [Aneurinibacillus danicus]|uniref:Uncharacterized protein n=1 Tax=Aneurinibacillus danicus TaxID=267746 RepID=A0A511VDI7_9BACL|nr:hypothetical protein ADA01nite_31130 [Aneurinibacillus danicus]
MKIVRKEGEKEERRARVEKADEQIVLNRDPMSSEAVGREPVKALTGK